MWVAHGMLKKANQSRPEADIAPQGSGRRFDILMPAYVREASEPARKRKNGAKMLFDDFSR